MSQAFSDVIRQVEKPGKVTILSLDNFILSGDITSMLHRRLRYTMTAKQVNAEIDVFLV